LVFDIKEPHYALSRSNSAVTFGVLSSNPTRCGSDEVYEVLASCSLSDTKNAACYSGLCAAELVLTMQREGLFLKRARKMAKI
jgi:hypothetical protein